LEDLGAPFIPQDLGGQQVRGLCAERLEHRLEAPHDAVPDALERHGPARSPPLALVALRVDRHTEIGAARAGGTIRRTRLHARADVDPCLAASVRHRALLARNSMKIRPEPL